MDFLPKYTGRHGRLARSLNSDAVNLGSESRVVPEATSRGSSSMKFERERARSSLLIIFLLHLVIVVALAGSLLSGDLPARTCAIGIGAVLTLHNVGGIFQRIVTTFFPGVSAIVLAFRGGLPLLGIVAVAIWLLKFSHAAALLNEMLWLWILVGLFVAACGILTKIADRHLGKYWLGSVQAACCVYLAVLYAGTFVVRFPGLITSVEGILGFILVAALIVRMWSSDGFMMPIQVLSVSYTICLVDSQARVEQLGATLGVALVLLCLITSIAIALGFIGSKVRA